MVTMLNAAVLLLCWFMCDVRLCYVTYILYASCFDFLPVYETVSANLFSTALPSIVPLDVKSCYRYIYHNAR